MKNLLLLVSFALSACNTASTSLSTPLPTTTLASEDCSQSNPIVVNWLRETTPADTLILSALQVATELYSNPSDTGRQEALDWQERTIQAYDFMQEYQPVPECLVTYHNFVTETLLQLSLTFSELELAYAAIDANQDHKPHLDSAKQHLSLALEASEASVNEWDRLKSLGLVPSELNHALLTPTPLLTLNETTTSNDNLCSEDQVTAYLEDVNSAMDKTNQLAYDFGQTQNREEATGIAKEMDDLFLEVSLWEFPECAKEVQINLQLVIANLASAQHALLNNDLDSFNRDYRTYEIALNQLNAEIKNLESLLDRQ